MGGHYECGIAIHRSWRAINGTKIREFFAKLLRIRQAVLCDGLIEQGIASGEQLAS